MADKDLRFLSRKELIEIIYEFQKHEVEIQDTIEKLTNELNAQEIKLKEAGSIADAALALNGVFEAAQKAANQYVLSVKAANEVVDDQSRKIIAEAQEEANAIIQKGKDSYFAWIEKGEAEYLEKVSQAEAECKKIRSEMYDYMVLHNTLKDIYADVAAEEVNEYA